MTRKIDPKVVACIKMKCRAWSGEQIPDDATHTDADPDEPDRF